MEWLKELLKSKNLTDEQIGEIKKGVETNYKGYVPESRLKEANEAKRQLESTLSERDKQLEELTKNAGNSETLQAQIKELQEANKQATEQYQMKVKEMAMNTALTVALSGKVHDVDVTMGLLDRSKIELAEDGKVKAGLDDQVKALRESKAFLFVPEQETVFKGFSPFEGQTGEPKAQNFGEMLAQSINKGTEDFTKAQEEYFK